MENPINCRHGCDNPTSLYYFDQGCACFPDQIQALCNQHIYKANPINGMEYICSLEGWNRGRPKMAPYGRAKPSGDADST